MSYMDEYNKLKKKRLEEETKTSAKATNSGTSSYMDEYNRLKTQANSFNSNRGLSSFIDPGVDIIARKLLNVEEKETESKKEKEEDDSKLDFFQKGSFEDGYQRWDVSKAILGTLGDAGLNVVKGIGRLGEGIGDLVSYGVAGVADLVGKDEFAESVKKRTQESVVDLLFEDATERVNKNSVLGRTSDAIFEGVGQVGGIIATGGLGSAAGLSSAGATALTSATMGLSSMGSGMGEAYQGGATDWEALKHGLNVGATDAISELIFGGLGKTINAIGFSKGLSSADDIVAKALSSKFKNQITKNIVEFGVKSGAEGLEEVIAGVAQAYSKHSTYMSDEEFLDILKDENLLEQFVVGAFTSGIAQAPSLHVANSTKTDFVTGRTQNEQAVVDKEVENRIAEKEKDGTKLTAKEKSAITAQVEKDLDKGYISTDTIESVLGGESYKGYQSMVERETALNDQSKSLTDEINTLLDKENPTMRDSERLAEARKELEQVKSNLESLDIKTAKSNLFSEVDKLTANDTKLRESYNEKARRGQAFEADLTKYNAKQQETIKKAIESGILNNTNRTHEFVDLVAKISADTGVHFDFTNNQKLKESGFAIDGKQVNGFVTKDGVTLNVQSAKSLDTVVGHEITHVLEGTELYTELQTAVVEYAKSKNDYQGRYDSLTKLYENIEGANIDSELTAELVGDYIFTDTDFIHNLSTNHRNVFQKIYDEVKYLYKLATAGSKEARELERVKKLFDEAYRGATKNTADSGVKYSIGETMDGRFAAIVDNDILSNIDTSSWDKASKKKVQKAASEELKKFSDGFTINGIEFIGNQDSRKEYTRSNYSEALAHHEPNAYLDKMRASAVLDDVIQVATEWKNDNELKHEREDYVDFVRGNTLIKSGDRTYRAVVLAGITSDGKAIFHDVVDVNPDTFEIKKSEPSTAVSVNESPNNILEDSDGATLTQEGDSVKRQFSLSQSIEQTKDLVALHNLTADKLTKSLELGGLPMPSLAITKADIPHSNFGDITLIFGKETIDPKANKKNKAYSADAWTPVFPRVEYEADSKVASNIANKLRELGSKIDDTFERDLYNLTYDFEDSLNRNGGEEGLVERVMDNYGLKAAYLEEQGKHIEKVTRQEEVKKGYNPDHAEKYQKIMDILGVTTGDEINKVNMKDARDNHGAELEAIYPGVTASAMRLGKMLGVVRSYVETKDSGPVYQTVTDSAATHKLVDETLDQEGYEAWVRNLYTGIEKNKGIYNNKDIFTPSGNRRSFQQTHIPVTLENIVKAMATQNGGNTKNVSGFNGVKTLRAATAETFKSVDEMHKRKDRLQNLTEEQLEAITDDLQTRLYRVIETIDNESGQSGESNSLFRFDAIGEILTEIGESGKFGVADIQSVFNQYSRNISDDTAIEVKQLLYDVYQMPVNIFEAKPERVVSFDEAKVFVIPRNSDVKLKRELLNRGYTIAEYDPDVEGDRQKVVNRFEEYQFSLSNVGEEVTPVGNFLGKDIALETAPVAETTTEAVETDIAPVAEAKVEDYAPGESLEEQLAKADDSLERLDSETETLFRDLSEQNITEEEFAEKWRDLDNRFTQARQEQERLSAEMTDINNRKYESLDDSDIPPEMEAPYYGDEDYIAPVYQTGERDADPFAERDMFEVGKRNVKAYMQENPEVKPFFQDAARGMLFDLQNGTKGERIFNEQLHYESGYEEGWMGTKRRTTDDIAALLDQWGYSYAQIEAGLNAIIEGNGKENNAVSKRIEFMLDNRLRNGYKDVDGRPIPADEGYINLLNSRESFDRFMEVADQYAPPADDVAPAEDIAPLKIEPAIEGEQSALDGFEQTEQEPERLTRAKLHKQIVDNVKAAFAQKGLDFDEVLKNAKRMHTLSTNDNTPQRVNDKTFGYEAGEALNELTFNRVALRESEGIKWLNEQVDTLRKLSKKYDIKPRSKESAAAQMYAEGFWVNDKDEIIAYGDAELAKDFPDVHVQNRIKALAKDPTIRKIYDDTLSAINESRTRNAYPEIPRLENYYLHFRAMEDTFSQLGVPFNPEIIKARDLPTDINGTTIDRKPGQPFFTSAFKREGKRTSFDMFDGLERYLNSAKNQIYHIDDIQTARALWSYIADKYGQAHGLENLDHMGLEAQVEQIQKVYNGHLSTYARFLNEYANNLAGKTAILDRALDGEFGRRLLQFAHTVNTQVGRNQVGYSISSPLTNFIPSMEAIARTSKRDSIKAFAQTVSNVFRKDGFVESDPTLIRRKGADKFSKTLWEKMSDPGYILMGAVDNVTSEFIVRTKYNELTRKGMDSKQAHIKAGEWASRVMGDRSYGQMPLHYNSKMLGLFTKYQLEVRNALDSQFYDTYQEAKASTKDIENQKEKNALTATKFAYRAVQIAALNHVFGMAFEKIAGYNPAFDIISTIATLFGWDDDEDDEDTFVDNAEQAFFELLGDLPYTGLITENGRIPIGSAMPIKQLISGTDKYGNEKSRWDTFAEALPYYVLPGGYGQIKKTTQGLGMFSEDHPVSGSYTDSGNLRFPVEKTFGNVLQAGVFGQYASENARDYFDNERSPLKEKQIQEYIDVDIPIKDYWDYREGLAKLKTNEEKVDYIDSLDLPLSKKNILVNNVLDRKEDVDLANYSDYGSLAEFDFAVKYPEKYQFLEDNGVTYEQYSKFDEDTKGAYNWAFENPEKYTMSQAISNDLVKYKSYTKGLDDITADKDENGKSINGSRKAKVFAYIESLPLDYGQKCILFKSQYKADDSMNMDIIEYLDSREDIDYDEMVTILRELDFTVEGNNVYWD